MKLQQIDIGNRTAVEILQDPPSLYKPQHVCGAADFAYAAETLDAVCPACSDATDQYRAKVAAREALENPETAWVNTDTGAPLPDIQVDPAYVLALGEEDKFVTRYEEYTTMCHVGGEKPMSVDEWAEFDVKYQEHVRTAGSVLSPPTFQRLNQVSEHPKSPKTEELEAQVQRAIHFKNEAEKETNRLAKVRLDLLARIELLEEHVSTVDAENKRLVEQGAARDEELRKAVIDRDDLIASLVRVEERYTKTSDDLAKLKSQYDDLSDEYVNQDPSYSGEDYENLLAIRDNLVEENESLIAEMESSALLAKKRTTPSNQPLFPHYYREVPNSTHVDVYWCMKAFDVHCPCTQHAIKKLFAAGVRGAKNKTKDLQEARDSITRALELEEQA